MKKKPCPWRTRSAAVGIAVTAALVLAGCGSASDTLSEKDKQVGAPTSASAEAIPTQDVVSGIKADPRLHSRLPASIKSSGVLDLGTTEATGDVGLPHSGTDSAGKQIGLDVDIRNAVANLLGVKLKTEYGTFETLVPGAQNGKYDVGQGNFAVTTERLKAVDFATYLKDGQSFLTSSDNDLDKVTKLTDVCGHTISTTPGSSFQQILESGAGECAKAGKKPYKVQYFSDTDAIILGLQNGKTDLYFGPTLSLKYLAKHQPNLKYLGELSLTDVGFVVAKGSPLGPLLVDAVNELIKDGDYAKIFDKWGVADIQITKSQLNPKPTF